MFRNKFLLLLLLLFYLTTIKIMHAQLCTQVDLCITGGKLPVYHKSDPRPSNMARYDFTRTYVIRLQRQLHVDVMQELEKASDSIVFPIYPKFIAQKINVLVAGSKIAHFEDILSIFEFTLYTVTCYNFQAKIDDNLKDVKDVDTEATDYDWKHFFHMETIYAWMDFIAKKYPKIITIISLGESSEHNKIKGVVLDFGCKPEALPDKRTTVFIEGGVHAREWVSPAAATFIINKLLTSKQHETKKISQKFRWMIVPIINPDGYKYSLTTDRLWQKNRRLFGSCRGVDLNRNFSFLWNRLNRHKNACANDYAGPSNASEIETKNLESFLLAFQTVGHVRTYISLHSYSQLITYPFSGTPKRSVEHEKLEKIAQYARVRMGKKNLYGIGSMYGTGTPMSGTSLDFAHGLLRAPVAYMIELRGNIACRDNYLLPAKEIISASGDALGIISEIVKQAELVGYYNASWQPSKAIMIDELDN